MFAPGVSRDRHRSSNAGEKETHRWDGLAGEKEKLSGLGSAIGSLTGEIADETRRAPAEIANELRFAQK